MLYRENLMIVGDLYGHVGTERTGCESAVRTFGVGADSNNEYILGASSEDEESTVTDPRMELHLYLSRVGPRRAAAGASLVMARLAAWLICSPPTDCLQLSAAANNLPIFCNYTDLIR